MGIYIKGMKMPKSCENCPMAFAVNFGILCTPAKRIVGDAEIVNRQAFCPIVPIQTHGRLIDADALMKTCGMAIDCYDCPNGEHGWCKLSSDAANICEAIEDAPTIIPAEEGE